MPRSKQDVLEEREGKKVEQIVISGPENMAARVLADKANDDVARFLDKLHSDFLKLAKSELKNFLPHSAPSGETALRLCVESFERDKKYQMDKKMWKQSLGDRSTTDYLLEQRAYALAQELLKEDDVAEEQVPHAPE